MKADVPKEIAELPTFPRQQLLDLWHKLHGRAAPPGIRRELLVPFLAYRIQEKAYGGLKPSTRAELRRIARSLEKGSVSGSFSPRSRIKPWTRIIRKWKDETHEVVVTETGFEYRGASFESLSPIARKITGTQWSGPAFFGLKNGASVEQAPDD